MRRHYDCIGLAFALALVVNQAAISEEAAQPQAYPAVSLLSTSTNVLGEPIHYPTTGPAQVTAAIVTLAPGEKTSIHKHGVPLLAYILEGKLMVDYAGYKQQTYHAGEAFMEAMNVAHFGINTGSKTMKLLVVYMGAQGSQNVIPVK